LTSVAGSISSIEPDTQAKILAKKLAVIVIFQISFDNLINICRFDWLLFSCTQIAVHVLLTSVAGSISSIEPDTQAIFILDSSINSKLVQ
jgi:hypothetical protein